MSAPTIPPYRVALLEEAAKLTNGDRDKEYGPPEKNLSECAALWRAYVEGKYGIVAPLDAEDVAWMNVLQKIARTYNGEPKRDTYVDAAAYSAIAGEVAK